MTTPLNSPTLRIPAAALLAALAVTAGCNRDPNVRKQKYLESGERYAQEGKYREATLQYFNALKADKNFAPAHYDLAKAFLKLGMGNQAYPELMTAVNLAPANAKARIDLGQLLLAGRAPDRAAEQANAVLKMKPDDPDALALLAGVAAAKGDRQGAIDTINKALSSDPNRADLHTSLGVLEGAGGKDLPAARQELEKAVQLDGKNTNAHLALAALLEVQNDLAGAETQLNAAISASPKVFQPRVALAALYLREKNMPQAEKVIQQASDDFPDDPEGAGLLERFYERTGQAAKAEPAYAALASKHPKSFPIQIAYARTLAAHEEFDKANAIVEKQKEGHDNDPQWVQLKTGLLLHAHKTDEAYTLLNSAVRNNPDNVDLKVALGFLARDRGDLNTAETNFRAALQRAPGNLSAASGLAEIASRKGDQSGLRQVAEQMTKLYPNAPLPYLWLGTADANDGHYDTAVESFQKVLKADPRNAQALVEMGQVRLKQNRVPEGRGLLEQALVLDPNSRALPLLVGLDMQANQPAAAIGLIQQQIARNPGNGGLLVQLASVQLAAKDPRGAMASAQQALKANPSDTGAMRVYTQAGLATNDVNGPIDMWTKWAGGHPQDAQAQSYLGMLAEATGDQNKAIAYYQKSLQLQPEQPTVQNNLAYLMAENGQNTDVALTLAQSAQRAAPNSPDITDTLAWVYYKKGVYTSALDLLQNAAKTNPDNASVQYHMGLTYEKLNNKPAAQTSLKKAATLGSGSDIGKKAQAELDRLG